jgi:hypothetical protein
MEYIFTRPASGFDTDSDPDPDSRAEKRWGSGMEKALAGPPTCSATAPERGPLQRPTYRLRTFPPALRSDPYPSHKPVHFELSGGRPSGVLEPSAVNMGVLFLF